MSLASPAATKRPSTMAVTPCPGISLTFEMSAASISLPLARLL